MSTGSFENWAGEISEIGAIFPFEEFTPLWVTAMMIFWLIWQVAMVIVEQNRFYDQVQENTAEKIKKMIE